MAIVYLGLGSNLGNRLGHLRWGLRRLADDGSVRIETLSSWWLTEPVGDAGMPWFLNAVARVESDLAPTQLLHRLLRIERDRGRARDPATHDAARVRSRTLDLDLLLYDSGVFEADELTIPHPRMHERRFVLAPLAELAHDLVHPRLGRTVEVLRDELPAGERAWPLAPADGIEAR